MHSDYTIQAHFVTVALCRYRVSGSDETGVQIRRPCEAQAHSLHQGTSLSPWICDYNILGGEL
jgi:hypothetical protein